MGRFLNRQPKINQVRRYILDLRFARPEAPIKCLPFKPEPIIRKGMTVNLRFWQEMAVYRWTSCHELRDVPSDRPMMPNFAEQ